MWYFWDSLNKFNIWHEQVKLGLGLPKPGINSATGEIDNNAQMTTDYTEIKSYENGFIAYIENDIANIYSDNIGVEINPIISNSME